MAINLNPLSLPPPTAPATTTPDFAFKLDHIKRLNMCFLLERFVTLLVQIFNPTHTRFKLPTP